MEMVCFYHEETVDYLIERELPAFGAITRNNFYLADTHDKECPQDEDF